MMTRTVRTFFLAAGFLVTGFLVPETGALAQIDRDSPLFPFNEVEPTVTAAPNKPDALTLQEGQKVLDIAVSPVGPDVMVLIETADKQQLLLEWHIGQDTVDTAITIIPLPKKTSLNSLAWHPKGTALYAAGDKTIFRHDPRQKIWKPDIVWKSPLPLERLLVGPRPFAPGYRLFAAQKQADGTRWIVSVDEHGKLPYYVTSAKPPAPASEDEEIGPNTEIMASAVPVAFHPAGHVFIMADAKGCFVRKDYEIDNWGKGTPLKECEDSLSYTPNGAFRMHWQPGKPGVQTTGGWISESANALTFLLPPQITPDGRGLVGVVQKGKTLELRYLPQEMPLADVVNAWMFIENDNDMKLLSANKGLFRPSGDLKQLYQLYDSESYYCGGFDTRQPTRPYLVTTDIMWEVYASAYQGLFMTVEREKAMPAFRELIKLVVKELTATAPDDPLTRVFVATQAVLEGNPSNNAEAAKIIAAKETSYSEAFGKETDYRNFAVRGHYTKDKEMAAYFQAGRYLGHMKLNKEAAKVLSGLSSEAHIAAMKWINAYQLFIAPSRAPLTWDQKRVRAGYQSREVDEVQVFPRSWGWDNEIFDATIHHMDRPLDGRMLPMGLDLASVFGHPLAEDLLEQAGEFKKYPSLKGRLAELRKRFVTEKELDSTDLYARWIRALAVQWSEQPQGPIAGKLWDIKRLQTGLASWATLRHTTILVNDIAVAECGEAGFESITMRPPRGYVEPDPETFSAIAALFDETIVKIRLLWPTHDSFAEGIIERLEGSRNQAMMFSKIARKEVRNEPLTPAEYAEIHYVGRAAEHNFLVFYSLMSEGNGLAEPDPIPKIAEVAGSTETGWLEAAVGHPLEWDQIAPSFGRREISKGAVYSYHELISDHPLSDDDWRAMVDKADRPFWVTPFVSNAELSCPPKGPQ